ncbi:MAG: hypothetical protein ACHQ53_15545 [Polyangiales bacterium]
MLRVARIGLITIAIGSSVPERARAEGRPTQLADHKPEAKDTALELELGLFARGGAFFTPHIDVRYAPSAHAELTFEWPIQIALASGAGVASGNPSAALYYMKRGQDGYFRIGGGFGLPLAPRDQLALPMNGMRDAWTYWPKALSFLVPAQLEIQRGALVLGGDFAGGAMIPVGTGTGATQIALQIAGLIGGRIRKVTLGTRLQGAWLPKVPGDNAQVALVPFVQGDFSDGGFLYARFTLNLDKPYGLFGNGAEGVWGLFIGGGSRQ